MRDETLSQHIDMHHIVFEPLEERLLLSDTSPAVQVLSTSPAVFVENEGQWADSSVRYAFQRQGAAVAFTDAGPVFSLGSSGFSASFVGARTVAPVGLNPSSSVFNYYVGDASTWRTNVPGFSTVEYAGLWDGVDLYLSGDQGNLKYEFHVAPGADPNEIAVSYSGIQSLSIAPDGSLLVTTSAGTMTDAAPVMYQEINGQRVAVAGTFTLLDNHTFGFSVTGPYDPNSALVIDPSLSWSTYVGGGAEDDGGDIAVDTTTGNAFVTGRTLSTGFAGANNSFKGSTDAFVAKVSSSGTTLWATYLGGSADEAGNCIVVDASGNVLVGGGTGSTDLAGANNSYRGGSGDAFVAKVSSSGSLLWATYLGGSGSETCDGIAVDASGNAFVTGCADSSDFAGANNSYKGIDDAFVAKVSPSGTTLWATYLGGSYQDFGDDIAVDASGNAFVTGGTLSTDFAGAINASHGVGGDGFLAKVSSSGSLLWAAYLGGSGGDEGLGIAVDASGNVLVSGETTSTDFPGAINANHGLGDDAFVAKVNSSGTTLWATCLGGSTDDEGCAIAVDASGNAFVTGITFSTDFAGANNSYKGGECDAFVAKVSSSGATLWATYLGGSGDDYGMDIALDAGNAFVTGDTTSTDVAGANNFYKGGSKDVFVAKIAGPDACEPDDQSWLAHPVAIDVNGQASVTSVSIDNANDADWFSFVAPYGCAGAVQVTVNNMTDGLEAHAGLYDSALGTLSDLYGGVFTTLYGPKATADATTAGQTVTLNWTGLTGGRTYCVKVSGLSGTTGRYGLGITAAMMAPDALESNNTSGTATNITANICSGNGACCETGLSIHCQSDEDWFRIDTPANTDGNLVATVSHLTAGLQGLVWVYQHYTWGDVPMGIGVYASWMPGGSGTATIYNAQPNTTYYIRVDNFWAETGGYQLDVTLPLDQQAKDAYEAGAGNNVSWLSAPITLTGNAATVNNLSIHNTADQDWFSFMPTTNGNVQITISGVSGGLVTHVGLYDSVIGSLADQYGGIYTTLFGPKATQDALSANQTVVLTYSGLHAYTTYYVKVSGLTSTTGLYTLGIAFTPTGSTGDAVPSVLLTA